MKKNELVHLHALLVRVAEDYVGRGEATPETFAAYHALGVGPTSLRESRATHQAAVLVLARLLAAVARGGAAEVAEVAEADAADDPGPDARPPEPSR